MLNSVVGLLVAPSWYMATTSNPSDGKVEWGTHCELQYPADSAYIRAMNWAAASGVTRLGRTDGASHALRRLMWRCSWVCRGYASRDFSRRRGISGVSVLPRHAMPEGADPDTIAGG